MSEQQTIRELAQACHMRAAERDDARGEVLNMQCDDYERRERIAKMLAMSVEPCDGVPKWDVLLARLNECLTTFRQRAHGDGPR